MARVAENTDQILQHKESIRVKKKEEKREMIENYYDTIEKEK